MKLSRALLLALPLAAATASAQTAVNLATWNFNSNSVITAPTGVSATKTIAGVGLNAPSLTGTGNSSTYPFAVAATNDVSYTSFPAATSASNTEGLEITVSTAGLLQSQYDRLRFSFDWRASNSGSKWAQVAYSTDNGTNWTNLGSPISQASGSTYQAYRPTSYAANGTSFVVTDAAAYGNANLKFRVFSIFAPSTGAYAAAQTGSTYATSGTWRFDNVGVEAVPEPASMAVLGLGLAAFRRRRARK